MGSLARLDGALKSAIAGLIEAIRVVRNLRAVAGHKPSQSAERCLAAVSGELQVLLPIEGLVDLDALRGRLEKDLAKATKEIQGLAGRLANPNFAGKAPPEVVAECRANLAEAEAQSPPSRPGISAEPVALDHHGCAGTGTT